MNGVNANRWARLRPLFDRAVDLDDEQRLQLLASLSAGDDADLRDDLARLLAEHARNEHTQSPDPAEIAGRLIAAVSEELPEGGQAGLPPGASNFLRTGQALRSHILESLASDETRNLREEKRVGEIVGSYRLTQLLETGGMGAVYLAERTIDDFHHTVAVKVLHSAAATDNSRERFDREREILAGLTHPNIAPLFEGGQTTDGLPFYTMEYVAGLPITEFCRTHTLGIAERVRLLLKVAGALAYAHQNLVVHRDIKPSNILVTPDHQVKLLDFGIAKLLDTGTNTHGTLTQSSIGPMTPEYAAPEQFRSNVITVATDVYQFGALCYRLLTGSLPYRADPDDLIAWTRAVSEEAPTTLQRAFNSAQVGVSAHTSRLQRHLATDLDAIVRKALAKVPTERYRTMDAMIADLNAFLDGRPVQARRAGPGYFAWRFTLRHRYAVAATVLAFAALVATTLVAVRQADLKAKEAERANTEAKRAAAVADFLIGLFQVSDPGVNRGEKLSANEILTRGAGKIDHDFKDIPEQRARLQAVIAEVYFAMGDYPRAQPVLEKAIATLRSLPTPYPDTLGHNLQLLGWVQALQGDHTHALALFEEAEGKLSGVNTPSSSDDLVRLNRHLALTLLWHGDYDSAERNARMALEIAKRTRGPDSEMAADAHQDLGLIEMSMGKPAESKANLEIALNTYQRVLGEDHPHTLSAESELGHVLGDLGDLAVARTMLSDVTERLRRVVGESNNTYGNALNNLGGIEFRQGLYEPAIEHYLAAEAVYNSLGDRYRYLALPITFNRGRALLWQGQFAAALKIFEQAYAERSKVSPPEYGEIAESLMFMAQALSHLNRMPEAVKNAEQGVAILREHPPADRTDFASALFWLGETYSSFGSGSADKARVAWREALDIANQKSNANSWRAAGIRRRILKLDPVLSSELK